MLLFTSCTKDLEIAAPEFDVTTEHSTYKKGEPVVFTFKGDPQQLSFYSGEVGRDYAFKTGRVTDVVDLKLKFNSSVTNGTQQGMFSLMVSTEFDGNYSSFFANMEAAKWKDVTYLLTKQEAATTTTINAATPADGIDLTNFRVAGKPMYIAFKYTIRPVSTHGTWRDWRFQAFDFSGTLATGGKQVFGNMTAGTFTVVQKNPEIPSRTTQTTATLTLMHTNLTTTPSAAEVATENWIVSKPFNDIHAIDFGPDVSIPIQGGTTLPKREYTHTFTEAGNYKVYFIAANTSSSERKEVIKELNITITD